MSRGKMLKALVQERLTVAAEEIFELFERVIAEYEEEQCRFKERRQANPEQQDFPTLQIQSVRGGVHFPSSGDHFPNQQITGPPQIKKEPDEDSVIKEEEDSLPVCVPQPSAICVKSEEHSLQQKQGDLRDGEACGEGISSETEVHTDMAPVTDDDEESEPRNIFSSAWMDGFDRFHYKPDTDEPQLPQDTDGPQCNQVRIRDQSTTTQGCTLSIKNTTLTKKCRKKHQCTICGKTFKKTKGLKNHLRIHTHTGKRPNSTSNSNETFSLEEMVVSKARVHTRVKTFSCPICQKAFSYKTSLDSHTRTHTGEKQYHCPVCKKSFNDKSNLSKHERLHTGVKPFCCSICNKTFSIKCNLAAHMDTHLSERPFTCSYCEKTFTRKESLNAHTRTHTGEKPFTCSVCEKTFAIRSNLYKHKKIHADKKLFSCSICNKTFSQKGALVAHGRIHTGEKPYNCSICKKAFTYKTSLDAHTKTHTGEKHFQCPVCKKSFSEKSNLTKHERLHSGEKPFRCSICNRTFAQMSNLQAHIKIHSN